MKNKKYIYMSKQQPPPPAPRFADSLTVSPEEAVLGQFCAVAGAAETTSSETGVDGVRVAELAASDATGSVVEIVLTAAVAADEVLMSVGVEEELSGAELLAGEG
jgi:hypothetical protein